MPAGVNALSYAEIPAVVDEEFLAKVSEILERLRAQSEMRGHPLLASLIAIAKDEAEDDLKTRAAEFKRGGLLAEADDSVIRIAQRFACGRRDEDDEKRDEAAVFSFRRA